MTGMADPLIVTAGHPSNTDIRRHDPIARAAREEYGTVHHVPAIPTDGIGCVCWSGTGRNIGWDETRLG